MKRYGASKGLKIQSAAARRTGIDHHVGEGLDKGIEVIIISLDVLVFNYSGSAYVVVRLPDTGRQPVEILTVNINSAGSHYIDDYVGYPLTALGIGHIEHSVSVNAELGIVKEPFVLEFGENGTDLLGGKAVSFGLKPKYRAAQAVGVGIVVYKLKGRREAVCINLPYTGILPCTYGTFVNAVIPAGVHPPVIELNAVIKVGFNSVYLALLGGSDHAVVYPRRRSGYHGLYKLIHGLTHIAVHKPFTPDVGNTGLTGVLIVFNKGHKGGTDSLARGKVGVEIKLSGRKANRLLAVCLAGLKIVVISSAPACRNKGSAVVGGGKIIVGEYLEGGFALICLVIKLLIHLLGVFVIVIVIAAAV